MDFFGLVDFGLLFCFFAFSLFESFLVFSFSTWRVSLGLLLSLLLLSLLLSVSNSSTKGGKTENLMLNHNLANYTLKYLQKKKKRTDSINEPKTVLYLLIADAGLLLLSPIIPRP